MKTHTNRLFTSVAFAALATICAPAVAQNTATADEIGADEGGEIIVTAQKRAERLQDVPLAVTAVTAAALENRGVTDTKSLTQLAPTLTYQQGANPSNSSFRIRGIGTSLFGQGTESSVSVVMDGVVLARQAQGFSDLADIERIEVLRGPQGTLFGKNATAGVISVVTARPTKEFSGKVNASIAEMGEYHLNGTVSAPVSDVVGVRISGFYNKDEGYIRNVNLGTKVNGYESYGVRGKLELDLGALNLLFAGEYSKNDAECCQQVLIRSDNANLNALYAPVVAGLDNVEVSSNLPVVNTTSQQTYSLEASYDLGSATLTSVTAYQKYNFNNNVDVDGIFTNVPIVTQIPTNAQPATLAQFDVNGGPFQLDQFSQELRLASSGNNRLNYVVGGYYSTLELDRTFVRRQVFCTIRTLPIGSACPTANQVGRSGSHEAHLKNEHIAAFGQVDFAIVGGLKALAGIRLQHEKISVTGRQNTTPAFTTDTLLPPGFPQTSGTTNASDSEVTGKAGLQYEFSRSAQMYATFTRGYKGQGLGTEFTQRFNNNPIIEPETVNAYEFGFKGLTPDRKLSIAAAVFLADYRNLQVQANRSDPVNNVINFITTNAGKSRTKGFEIEATVRPDDNLTINMSAAYVKARFDAPGQACPLQNQAGAITLATGAAQPNNICFILGTARTQNIVGGILPNTPTWRLSFNPRYEREVGSNLLGFADVNVSYQSDVNFSLEQDPTQTQEGYATADARIGVRQEDRGFNASVFVKNLFDTRYFTAIGAASLLTTQAVTPLNRTAFRPKGSFRYFGASVGYSF